MVYLISPILYQNLSFPTAVSNHWFMKNELALYLPSLQNTFHLQSYDLNHDNFLSVVDCTPLLFLCSFGSDLFVVHARLCRPSFCFNYKLNYYKNKTNNK